MGLKQPEIVRSRTEVELGPPSDGGGRGLRATVYRFDAEGKVIRVDKR